MFVLQVPSNSSLVQRAARTSTGAVGATELGAVLNPEQARLGSQVISTMTPQLVAAQKTGESKMCQYFRRYCDAHDYGGT